MIMKPSNLYNAFLQRGNSVCVLLIFSERLGILLSNFETLIKVLIETFGNATGDDLE